MLARLSGRVVRAPNAIAAVQHSSRSSARISTTAAALGAAGGLWLLSDQQEKPHKLRFAQCEAAAAAPSGSNMLAFVVEGDSGQLREVPRPVPKDGEVLVKVRRAGVCNTDLEVGVCNTSKHTSHDFATSSPSPFFTDATDCTLRFFLVNILCCVCVCCG